MRQKFTEIKHKNKRTPYYEISGMVLVFNLNGINKQKKYTYVKS